MTVEHPYTPRPVFGLDTALPEPVNACANLDLLLIQNLLSTHEHCLTDGQRDALTDLARRLCAQLGLTFDLALIAPDPQTNKNSIISELHSMLSEDTLKKG